MISSNIKSTRNAFSKELSFELNFTKELCKTIGSPFSIMLYLMIEYEDFKGITELSIDADNYLDVDLFADDYLLCKVLKKSPNLPLDVITSDQAIKAFFECEESCKLQNQKIEEMRSDPALEKVRKIVSSLLGPLSSDTLNGICDSQRFSSGTTTALMGDSGWTRSTKYDGNIHLTDDLYPFARSLMGESWIETSARKLDIVRGNVFCTVPKTSLTDRPICIEPSLNMRVQLGIGHCLKTKLKNFGFSIQYQEKNRELAKRAYDDSLATIDFSSASDTIAWSLVRVLLPDDWFHLLELCRSKETFINDEYINLHKFSSMGNGYTFELESIIFLAMALSVVPMEEWMNVSIYGDDLIVPQSYVEELSDIFTTSGVYMNDSKSFLAGNFFESCGADYFKKQNVKGFTLSGSGDIHGLKLPGYIMQTCNRLREYAQLRGGELFCSKRFLPLWRTTVRSLPKSLRNIRVPHFLGDVGLVTSKNECLTFKPPKERTYEGYRIVTLATRLKTRHITTSGVLLDTLDNKGFINPNYLTRAFSTDASYGFVPVRGWLGKPNTEWLLITEWPDSWAWL